MRTLMHTDAQRLLDHRSAPATVLRCSAWVNLDIPSTSFFRFVARIGGELSPRRIRNTFRQTVLFEHPYDAQVLENDHAETLDQLSAYLMGKVLPAVRYPFVDAGNHFSALRPFWRSLRLLTQTPLRPRKVAFVSSEKARVRHLLARRERGKLLQADIHTYCRFRHVAGLLTRFFNGKGNKPLAGTTTPQRDGLIRPSTG